ncbi:hypothetical protein CYMTET_46620 [Cymbomonas tetramitiformis]|uniref:Sodium/calcium exchanger membrane region domain-containing protein n=1 Tax=Cymbomonas tetramitiformis TaxID=36881 RepID=A0AAE0EXF2_9CHLO|nr:hypothetical protein CYMTET_46620 [Cymbomonas tetramitiformis]
MESAGTRIKTNFEIESRRQRHPTSTVEPRAEGRGIARALAISPDVAGATLLALGNAAPDFFAQLAALTNSAEVDIPLALGASVGGGVYVISFCVFIVIILSPKQLEVSKWPFFRDVVTLFISISVVARGIVDESFELHESASLVILYFLYLYAVKAGGRYFPEPSSEPSFELVSVVRDEEEEGKRHTESSTEWVIRGFDGSDLSPPRRVSNFFLAVINAVQSLSVPPVESDTVSKSHALIIAFGCPLLTMLVFFWDFPKTDARLFACIFTLASFSTVCAWRLYPEQGLPAKHGLLLGVAFLGAISWMQFAADEIVETMQSSGQILGLPDAFLGGTVVAWGASTGDLAALIATARAVHFSMHGNLMVICTTGILLCLSYLVLIPTIFKYKYSRNFGWLLLGLCMSMDANLIDPIITLSCQLIHKDVIVTSSLEEVNVIDSSIRLVPSVMDTPTPSTPPVPVPAAAHANDSDGIMEARALYESNNDTVTGKKACRGRPARGRLKSARAVRELALDGKGNCFEAAGNSGKLAKIVGILKSEFGSAGLDLAPFAFGDPTKEVIEKVNEPMYDTLTYIVKGDSSAEHFPLGTDSVSDRDGRRTLHDRVKGCVPPWVKRSRRNILNCGIQLEWTLARRPAPTREGAEAGSR